MRFVIFAHLLFALTCAAFQADQFEALQTISIESGKATEFVFTPLTDTVVLLKKTEGHEDQYPEFLHFEEGSDSGTLSLHPCSYASGRIYYFSMVV